MALSEGDHVTLTVKHRTAISFSEPVTDLHFELHMSPVNTGLQRVPEHSIGITPDTLITSQRDHFGNRVAHFSLPEVREEVEITAASTVVTTNAVSCGPESAPDPRPYQERWQEFLRWSPAVPELAEYGSIEIPRILSMDMDDIEFGHGLYAMARYFFKTFRYDPDVTHLHATPQDLFDHGGGTCQDMAHAMIGVLRQAGIPSRYASGYLFSPAAGEMGEHLRGATSTHAWVQAWHEGYGWIGVDPANETLVDWQYIRTAIGRDHFDVPSNRVTFSGNADQSEEMSVQVELAGDAGDA